MTAFTFIASVFSFALTLMVLSVNPRRSSNRAFSLVLLVLSVWLACVYAAMREGAAFGYGEPNSLEFWLRANAAVAAFLPPSLWLLTSTVTSRENNQALTARVALLFLPSIACACLTFTETFLYQESPRMIRRGTTYYVYNALGLSVYIACLYQVWRRLRSSSGIRRVELQFLALNFGVAAIVIAILNLVGNLLQFRTLNRASVLVVFGAAVLTAWALLFHRVFNAREVILGLAKRAVVILGTGGGLYAIWYILQTVVSPTLSVVLSAFASAPMAIWFERNSRVWFGIATEQRLATLRRLAIEHARIEPNVDQLVNRFSRLLKEDFRTPSADLLFAEDAKRALPGISVSNGHPGNQLLCELGWATPESLDRRRATSSINELKTLLAQYKVALIVAVPRGSPKPSLIITLGTKSNEWPFTYPEVERLQNIAELMDNILTHSRLTEQAALQAKMEHLAMMSRGLAHDLKNLITPVSSFLIHTEGRYPPKSPEEEVHAAARNSVRVMTDYVREALFFSERLQPKFERIDLNQLFATACEVTAPRAGARGVTVTTHIEFHDSPIADMVLLQRMLANLIGNAVDASTKNQTVRLLAHNGCIGWIRFEIIDEGCGIAPDHLSRIFDPYFTTKEYGDEVRGFGLGLTISQKIAELHHGTISVRSQLGEGTTITVELPVSQPATAAPAPSTAVGTAVS